MGLVSGVVWPVPADGHRGGVLSTSMCLSPLSPKPRVPEGSCLPAPLLSTPHGCPEPYSKANTVTEVGWTDPDLASLVPSFPAPSDLALPSTSHPIKTSLDPRPSF